MKDDKTTKKESLQTLVAVLKKWQGVEDGSVALTTSVLAKTKNPLIRLIMEIIQQAPYSVTEDMLEPLLENHESGSIELLVPIQDVFGWRDRINTPATVTDRNWTWRLPWPVNRLDDVPEARASQALTLALGQRHGRA
jgi:4-alpha-glucanotransferase